LQVPKRSSSYFHRKQSGIRAGLLFLLASTLLVGIWALLAPRSFFDDFPGLGMTWVKPLPKFNEHIIRDVGGLNLGFALLFGWAASTLDRRLIQVSSLAWLLYAIPHLIFHVFHLEKLSTQEAVLQTTSLALLVLIPIVLVLRSSRQDRWAIRNTARFSSGR
jgi:hypothetical protein